MAIGSSINSPLCQKFSFKFKNNHKNKRKAFSVAEATIALLIGSVALSMAAPMITKQIKQQNYQDVQFRRVSQQLVPKGAIMFFGSDSCPDGWSAVNFNGRFVRFAGAYDVCDISGENSDGTCVDSVAKANVSNPVGRKGGDTIRDYGEIASSAANAESAENSIEIGATTQIAGKGAFAKSTQNWSAGNYSSYGYSNTWSTYKTTLILDLSNVSGVSVETLNEKFSNLGPSGIEIAPKFVSLLGCIKN